VTGCCSRPPGSMTSSDTRRRTDARWRRPADDSRRGYARRTPPTQTLQRTHIGRFSIRRSGRVRDGLSDRSGSSQSPWLRHCPLLALPPPRRFSLTRRFHRRSQRVQWVHQHPQGGEKNLRRTLQEKFVSAPPSTTGAPPRQSKSQF